MYQIGAKLLLLNMPAIWPREAEQISLRGYNMDEPVALPAEFMMVKLDGKFPSLSVEKIASRYCPARRDLYLEKVRKIRPSAGQQTWGRIAGHLIESYCTGLLDSFGRIYRVNHRPSYDALENYANQYTAKFIEAHSGKFQELRDIAGQSGPEDSYEKFILSLKYTAKYELAMLGIDWLVRRSYKKRSPSLLKHVPIKRSKQDVSITPREGIGLGKEATPDFIVSKPLTIGDVKSGDSLKQFHFHTCAGYALAYESQFGEGHEVNYGIIYFFETHRPSINSAQTVTFLIDDRLRKEFLDSRNEAYRLVQAANAPTPLEGADRKQHCTKCKYSIVCDQDRA